MLDRNPEKKNRNTDYQAGDCDPITQIIAKIRLGYMFICKIVPQKAIRRHADGTYGIPPAWTDGGPLYQERVHHLGLTSSFEIGSSDKHAILAFMISSIP